MCHLDDSQTSHAVGHGICEASTRSQAVTFDSQCISAALLGVRVAGLIPKHEAGRTIPEQRGLLQGGSRLRDINPSKPCHTHRAGSLRL
jgi:hypothetical protein